MHRAHCSPPNMLAVAQLVERQIVALDVAGSSPVRHPIWRINPKGKGPVLKTGSSGASRVWFRDPHPPPNKDRHSKFIDFSIIAQLVERPPFKQNVVGSSPTFRNLPVLFMQV